MSDVTVTMSEKQVARYIRFEERRLTLNLPTQEQAQLQEIAASLAALRNAKPAGETWEPVFEGYVYETDIDDTTVGWMQRLLRMWDDDHDDLAIALPDDIRLCRRRTEGA